LHISRDGSVIRLYNYGDKGHYGPGSAVFCFLNVVCKYFVTVIAPREIQLSAAASACGVQHTADVRGSSQATVLNGARIL